MTVWNIDNSYDDFFNDLEIYFMFIKGMDYGNAKISIRKLMNDLNELDRLGVEFKQNDHNKVYYRLIENNLMILYGFCGHGIDLKLKEYINVSNKNINFNGESYYLLNELISLEDGVSVLKLGLKIRNIALVLNIDLEELNNKISVERNKILNEEYVRV